MDWVSLISAASNAAGQYAKNSAAGRVAEAGLNQGQDSLRNSQYNTAQNAQMQGGNLDLNRKSFSEGARGNRAKQALIGDLLANFKGTNISTPGIKGSQISGGLADSMGLMGKAAGSELSRQALLKLLEGDTFEGGDILPQPGVTAQPKASTFEKIMAGIGTGGALAGSIAASQGAGGGGDSGGTYSNLQDIMKKLQAQQNGGG